LCSFRFANGAINQELEFSAVVFVGVAQLNRQGDFTGGGAGATHVHMPVVVTLIVGIVFGELNIFKDIGNVKIPHFFVGIFNKPHKFFVEPEGVGVFGNPVDAGGAIGGVNVSADIAIVEFLSGNECPDAFNYILGEGIFIVKVVGNVGIGAEKVEMGCLHQHIRGRVGFVPVWDWGCVCVWFGHFDLI